MHVAHCQCVQKAGVQVYSVQDEATLEGYNTLMKEQIRKGDQVYSNAFKKKRSFCQERVDLAVC